MFSKCSLPKLENTLDWGWGRGAGGRTGRKQWWFLLLIVQGWVEVVWFVFIYFFLFHMFPYF